MDWFVKALKSAKHANKVKGLKEYYPQMDVTERKSMIGKGWFMSTSFMMLKRVWFY